MDTLNEVIRREYEKGTPVKDIASLTKSDRTTVIRRAKVMGLNHPNRDNSNRVRHEAERLGLDFNQVDHGWIKTDDVSIHFRNDLPQVKIEDLFTDVLGSIKKHSPKYPKLKRIKIAEPHLLVIDPADIHVGKLALAVETGEDYNIDIAKQRCIEGVRGLLQKAQGFPVDKIILVIGNDILHFDNNKRTTTSGTSQDTDGQLHQIFTEGVRLYVDVIEMLLPIADVEVVYNPSNHDNGYKEVSLNFGLNRNGTSKYVHRLVAETFLGQIPKGFNVNHKDGNKSNNRLSNLEIVSFSENTKHAISLGLFKPKGIKGSKHHKSKINERNAKDIKKLYNLGLSVKLIARRYPQISRSTVSKIAYGSSWKHI